MKKITGEFKVRVDGKPAIEAKFNLDSALVLALIGSFGGDLTDALRAKFIGTSEFKEETKPKRQ